MLVTTARIKARLFVGALGLMSLAALLEACRGGSTSPPPTIDSCAGMPTPPPTTGTPIGTCPHWIGPPAVDPAGGLCPDIGSFEGQALLGPHAGSALHCRYHWSLPRPPTSADVATLPAGTSQDCTYLTPQGHEDALNIWARSKLRGAVQPQLAPSTATIDTRVIVLDTVPEHSPEPGLASLLPRGAQHGQTLAWMVADLACTDPKACPLQVRRAMALPRQIDKATGLETLSAQGGSFGLLSDAADALWGEVRAYRDELQRAVQDPISLANTPLHMVMLSAFGYASAPGGAVCDDNPGASTDRAVVALFEAYSAAACLGALHVAAAGNSSGGDDQGTGLLCPARWDKAVRPTEASCAALFGANEWTDLKQSYATFVQMRRAEITATFFRTDEKGLPADHLLSVGAVDYHGLPLVLSRPGACAEAVALGLGGIGWVDEDHVPPALFGTSVSAAVAAARLGIAWQAAPQRSASNLVSDTLTRANRVPFARPGHCATAAGVACATDLPWIGEPTSRTSGQNPVVSKAETNLLAQRTPKSLAAPPGAAVCVPQIPHCVRPSRAATSALWPQPIDPLCVKCGIFLNPSSANGYPEIWMDGNTTIEAETIVSAVLIVEDEHGTVVLTKPLDPATLTTDATIILDEVPASIFTRARAWISAYMRDGQSLSQPMFVIE